MTDQLDEKRAERLAAWLDGAMNEADAAAFAAEMECDPALAERAARWRANDQAIAQAFAPMANETIDPALVARLGLATPVAAPSAANDNPPWWRRHLPLTGALVASAAAALALVIMPRGGQAPLDPLSQALETTPSLAQASLADGRRIVPMLTVRAADGRWCREYRGDGRIGLACRGANGWTVEAEGKASNGEAPSGDDYALASGADGAALEGAYRRLGATDPVDGTTETAAIAAHWQAKP